MATEMEKTRDRLLASLRRERPLLDKYDAYFEGEQPLRFISPVLQRELGDRHTPLMIEMPRFITDVYDARLDITGFRYGGAGDAAAKKAIDDELWRVFEHNDGRELSQQVQREQLALGRAYVVVGENDDDAETPVMTIESPFDAIHEDNPRTHTTEHGIKTWTELDKTRFVSFYHPNGRQTWYRKSGEWVEDSNETNTFELCRLVPLINEPRILGRLRRKYRYDQRLGRSVFHSVLPLLDALNKIATDMMTSAEFHALPRRWATGLDEDDFTDEATGKQLDTFSLIAGRLWAVGNDKASFGQFQEADLKNFHETMKLLVQFMGMLLGLPGHYFDFGGDNPASADAIRSSESQLVKRAERKQATLSTRWERVQRLVLLTQGNADSAAARQIETLYRDPSTPTIAQAADAVTKLVTTRDAQGRSIVPVEIAREKLGYSPDDRKRMAEFDKDPYLDHAERPVG